MIIFDIQAWLNKLNFKNRLIFLFSIFSLICCITIGVISYFLAFNALKTTKEESLSALGQSKATEIKNIFETQINIIKSMATSKFIQDAAIMYENSVIGSGTDLSKDTDFNQKYYNDLDNKHKEIFDEMIQQYGIKNFGIIQSNGSIIAQARHDYLLGKNLLKGEYKESPLSTGLIAISKANYNDNKIYFVDLFYSDKLKRLVSFLIVPIFSKYNRDVYAKNDRMGYLYIELDWNIINNISNFKTGLGNKGELFVIAADGFLRTDISSNEVDYKLQNTIAAGKKITENTSYKDILENSNIDTKTIVKESRNYNNKNVMSSYSKIDLYGNIWIIVAEMDLDEVYWPIRQMRFYIIFFTIFALVVGTFYSIKNAKTISLPIIRVAQHLDLMSQKDFSIKVSKHALSRTDEMGIIAKSLNQLNISLQSHLTKMNHIGLSLSNAADTIVSGSDSVSSTLSQSVDTMSKSNNEIKQTVQQVKDTVGKMSQTTKTISDIEQTSKQIAFSINSINEITQQIGILSINASIESAKAGEHGRGFAVIALEIKELALKSNYLTQDITNLVKSSLQKVNEGVDLISNTEKKLNDISLCISQLAIALEESCKDSAQQREHIQKFIKLSDNLASQAKEVNHELSQFKIG
ncbi:MAG: hypothetical protein HQK49_10055 [Oligoflexia bacterium]|nr:hypothetical protein [Oligoflexia bacterium]